MQWVGYLSSSSILCIGADLVEGSSSPQGTFLRRRRRQVPLSAMPVEITALEDAENDCSGQPGLSQKELDELTVGSEDSGSHCSSPASSRMYRAKRSALLFSNTRAAVVVQAGTPLSVAGMSPGHEVEKTVGLSQKELDAVCLGYSKRDASVAPLEGLTKIQEGARCSQEHDMKRSTDNEVPLCRSPAGNKKRNPRIPPKENQNWCCHADENASPSSRANAKELSQASPNGSQNQPLSPMQQRKLHSAPLSPLKWQSNLIWQAGSG